MLYSYRPAKIRIKVLLIVLVVTVALGTSLIVARQVRRQVLSKRDFAAGQAAYEAKDWANAYEHFQEFLGRNPDNVEILKKYAQARLSMRPLEPAAISRAISAYRRVIQLDPLDEIAYSELARLYGAIGQFNELAYIAKKKMEHYPDDKEAPLWLANALIAQDKQEEARKVLETYIAEMEALPGADKLPEYVQAWLQMSLIPDNEKTLEEKISWRQNWLEKAMKDFPESVEALVQHAQFYMGTDPGLLDMTQEQKSDAIRQDLETSDNLGTNVPQLRFALAQLWLTRGELDRAEAELDAIDKLDQETLNEHYLDLNDFLTNKSLFDTELALRRSDPEEAASLADAALDNYKEPGYRVRILPSAIGAYTAAGRISDANKCLDEYAKALQMRPGPASSRSNLAYLQAMVAEAEEKPYAVIEVLQPALTSETARPDMWRRLIMAYNRTSQTQKAVSAMTTYLRLYPQDGEMTLQLAQGYLTLRNWSLAFETATQAESLMPEEDIRAKLVRIESAINLAVKSPARDTGRLKALATELVALRQSRPELASIRTLQAMIALAQKQPKQAEQELKLALGECEESLGARLQLVRYYFSTQQMDAALETCKQASEQYTESPQVWLYLAQIQTAREDYDAARSYLRQGLDHVTDPWQKRSLSLSLARLELMHGKRTTGIDLLSKLAEQDDLDIEARSLLLDEPEVQADRAKAEKLIEELKNAEGENGPRYSFYQAALWMASDDWRTRQEEISKLLHRCLDADPQQLRPALLLLKMYNKLKDSRSFEDTCKRVLLRNPAATNIASLLVNLLEKQGRFAEAQKIVEQMEANSPVATAWQVRNALRTGDVSAAIHELEVIISNNDQDAESRIYLARLIYQQTGDVDKAFVHLKQAEAITPDSRSLITTKVSILGAAGRTEEARKVLDDFVTQKNTFDAYQLRAAYRSQTGDYTRAEQDYKKLTTFTEQGATGTMLLSSFYIRNQKADAAVNTLKQGATLYPQDLNLKRMLMQTLTWRGRSEDQQEAQDILKTLEEKMPNDPDLMMLRVQQLLNESTPQSIQSAQDKLEQVVAIDPTSVTAHLTLIGIALKKKEYEAARKLVMRALGSNADNPALMSARSTVELALGNVPLASQIVHLVLAKDPNQVPALGVLLDIAMESQDSKLLEEAGGYIDAAADSHPTDENLQIMQSQALTALKLPQKAIEKLESYSQSEQGRDSLRACVKLASLYRQVGQMDQARQKLDQAQKLSPNAQLLIGERINWITTLYQSGKADQARTLFRELLTKHPSDTSIMNNLAWLLQEHYQSYEDALALVNKGLSLVPDDLHLLDTRGTILLKMGRLAEARQDFNKQVQLSPGGTRRQAMALLQLGRVCAKFNDLAQANQHLTDALAIDRKIDVFTPEERSEIAKILEKTK